MSKTLIIFALVCLLSVSSEATAEPPNTAKPSNPAVVVELFTSEGCSSCPPADQVLTRLRAQPVSGVEIITLSEHVPYWNCLGWTDPFSQEIFSKRQKQYAFAFRKPSVYTPQMVIDGKTEMVGSNFEQAISDIKSRATSTKAAIEFSGTVKYPNQIFLKAKIRLPEYAVSIPETVFVALLQDNLLTSVKNGENAGRRLPHNSVVRALFDLGMIKGKELPSLEKTLQMPLPISPKDMRLVLFIQSAGGEIVGASTAPLSLKE